MRFIDHSNGPDGIWHSGLQDNMVSDVPLFRSSTNLVNVLQVSIQSYAQFPFTVMPYKMLFILDHLTM